MDPSIKGLAQPSSGPNSLAGPHLAARDAPRARVERFYCRACARRRACMSVHQSQAAPPPQSARVRATATPRIDLEVQHRPSTALVLVRAQPPGGSA
eukprot:scaffold7099_cov131-Isochrysis_galbana.AAC.18